MKNPLTDPNYDGNHSLKGFSLLETLIGLLVLVVSFVSLTAYLAGQKKGLLAARRISDAVSIGLSALEETQRALSDSNKFQEKYLQIKQAEETKIRLISLNKTNYTVRSTLQLASAPDSLLKEKVSIEWLPAHKIKLGTLVRKRP